MDRNEIEAFRLLGLPVDSDQGAVIRAYRRLARATHPDVSPDPRAATRFATLAAAYRLLAERTGPRPESAPADGPGQSPEAPARHRDADRDRSSPAWGTTPGWSMPVGWTRRDRPPIVAGPVVIRPPSSHGPGEVPDG